MSSSLERLLDVTLPNGGYAVAVAEAYFDESGTHDGSPFMTVAGYVFEANAARIFSQEWKAALAEAGVPYFHATDCVVQNGPFAHLSDDECDKLVRKLIPIIKRHMTLGVSSSVNRIEYAAIMPKSPLLGDDYQFCGARLLEGVRRALEQIGASFDQIAFFFEAGHSSQSALGRVVYDLMNSSEARATWRYSSHSFIGKEEAAPIQAADFFAWQVTKSFKCKFIENRSIRGDFKALVDGSPHIDFYAGRSELVDIVGNFLERGLFKSEQSFSELWKPSKFD